MPPCTHNKIKRYSYHSEPQGDAVFAKGPTAMSGKGWGACQVPQKESLIEVIQGHRISDSMKSNSRHVYSPGKHLGTLSSLLSLYGLTKDL